MKNNRIITTTIFLLFVVSTIFARTTITMEKDGGVYKVPCVVNGLRMKFIFDTGAANVCISESMATYMLENDYLDKSDILGTGQSSVADGRIVDHVKIRLSTLEIGGLKLNNVEAVVIEGQTSPLLLGQSAISKMGKVSINGNQLIIEEAGGDCSQADIDTWDKLANDYYEKDIYDKAALYFQKIYDCDRLSDYGQFLLGLCYQLLDNERQALSIFEVLQQKVSNHTAKLSIDSQIELYANMAICYKVIGNINASTNYNLIALSNLNDSEWQLAADLCCSIAMNYFVQKNYKEADNYALVGIEYILRNKYPSIYKEWERKRFKDLSSVLSKYRWGKEEVLGNLIFIICDDYYNTYGEPHCQMLRIAAEMGFETAQESIRIFRGAGICSY